MSPRLAHALVLLLPWGVSVAQLDLPEGAQGSTREVTPPASDDEEPIRPATALTPLETGPAAHVVAELMRISDAKGAAVDGAVVTLLGMGSAGLEAAQGMLLQDHTPLVVAGARTLLVREAPGAKQAVLTRLRSARAGRIVVPLFEVLSEAAGDDLTSSELLLLLEHPHGAVRGGAARALEPRVEVSLLPTLREHLVARRSDTRLRALGLVALLDVPERTELVMRALEDPRPNVAWRAVEILAALQDERIPGLLRDVAFAAERSGLTIAQVGLRRREAYALLALVEREDRHGVALLDDSHTPGLLSELTSTNPLVSGTCAVALAGIGFRSQETASAPWLDREVPHLLVRAVSGAEFHNDFTSLQVPAQRRLSLLSGESFGQSGPEWRNWWVAASGEFKANRAYLSVSVDSPARLELYYRDAHDREAFHLLGPAVEGGGSRSTDPRFGERFHLDAVQSERMFQALFSEGVFGATRLPGLRGSNSGSAELLFVTLDGEEKAFTFGQGAGSEAWVGRVAGVARALALENSWQRWTDPLRHASRRELWLEERDFWSRTTTPGQSGRREKRLILTHLASSTPESRNDGLSALEELYRQEGVTRGQDFDALLELVRQESWHSPRVERLVRLALSAATAGSDVPGVLPPAAGQQCISTLLQSFQGDSEPEIALVLAAGDSAQLSDALAHDSAFVRAAGALVLGQRGYSDGHESRELLIALLDDPSARVEAAAVRSLGLLGASGVELAVLERARAGHVYVRTAALEAAGRLHLDGALEFLTLGLTEPEAQLQLASTRGLAALGERRAARPLVHVLARGEDSPLYETAREGLIDLGADAWPDLLRSAQTGLAASRRDAALLLSQSLCPDSISPLVILLSDNPEDAELAFELAVVSGIDLRTSEAPALAWWDWWDAAPRGDAQRWLVDSVAAMGLSAPPADALKGDASLAGARFLLGLLRRPEVHLAERARREMARVLERPLEPLPEHGVPRGDWVAGLTAEVDRRFGG